MSNLDLAIRIRANADGSLSVINAVGNSIQNTSRQADLAQGSMERLSSSIARVGHYAVGAFGISWAGSKVSEVVGLADKMTLLDSRVKIATSSLADYRAANTALTQIAKATGSSLEANITMFGRLNKSVESSGGSFKTTLEMITTLNEGFKISGASTEEAKSVMIQLSQALSSGVLRGDEFNSVMENGSRIVDALTTATGKTKGELRAMAEAGQLSSDVVINALHSQAAAIHRDFAAIPLTIGAALENISTSWARYLQDVNNATGTTSLFASSLNAIATHFTPIADGLTTLAQVAAAVFAVKMTGSVMSYITTLRTARAAAAEAAALELAHSTAIRQNLQVSVVRAEALVAETGAQVAAGVATTASIMAERALITTRLQQVGATIAQAQATIAATSATIQNTSVIYLNRQATEALAISEEKRAAIIAELALLGRQQAAVSAQVTAAQAAQTAATTGLSTAEEALAGPSLGVASGFTLASVAMGALNAGVAIFIGWQIADYLNQFVVVQNAGAMAANYLVKTWETLNYVIEKSVLLLKLDFEGARQLRLEHEASMATHNAITNSIIANNNAQEKSAVLSGEMAAELKALRSPQEVYNQKIKVANEAAKTLDATTGRLIITEEQRLALGVKALGVWQQANAAEQNAKVSNAAKEVEKLQAQYDKLALPPQTYNKKYAQSFEGTPEEKASIESLSNAIVQLNDSKKILTTHTQAQESAANKAAQSMAALESSYTSQVDTLLKSIALEGDASAKKAMQYDVEKGALRGLSDTQKKYLIEKTTLLQTKQAEIKVNESAKSEMDALNDKYNQLTLSAREYYALSLANKGIAPQQQAPILAQFDKNAGLEAASKSHADATQSLETYNKSLEQAKTQTSDLGAVTKAVFDGALGGINAVAGAFGTMVDAIGKNTQALTELHAKQVENDNYVPNAKKGTDEYNKQLKFKADNAALYAKHEAELNNKNLKDQLAGASQIAGAASKMFDEKSAAAKAFHGVEITLSVARLAMDAVEMASTLAKIPVNIAAGASAMFAALGPFGFAAVAAMMATMAGLGFAGGSSVQEPPKSSPDTGTVLGDKTTSSQSIDKTYQLLKDIHASEYVELIGINQGVSDLQSAITNTVTKVFQAGGLDLSNRGINLSKPSTGFLSAPGNATGNILGGLFSMFSGGYRNVTERGISTPSQQLSNVGQQGFQAQQYNVVKTRTWDLFSDSTRYDTVMTTLDSKVTSSMTRIFSATGEVMTSLAKSFGGDLQAKVSQYVIPALRIDLTNLNADDAAKKLNGVISTALDTMATSVFGDIIGQYQKLGEGMLETAVRIVSEVAVVKDAFAQAGVKLSDNAISLSDALVQAAGGLQNFQSAIQSFYDKFFTDAQKQARDFQQLTAAFSATYQVLPTTRAGYAALNTSISDENAINKAKLNNFTPAQLTNTTGGLAAKAAADLSLKRYEVFLDNVGLAAAYYDSIEADSKQLKDTIASTFNDLSNILTGTISKMTGFIDGLKSFSKELSVGALAPGGAALQTSNVRAEFTNNVSAIKKGYGSTDAEHTAFSNAIGSLQSNATSFLNNSMATSSSAAAYRKDYNSVQAAIQLGIAQSVDVKDTAQLQLDTAKQQVSSLITLNDSVKDVTAAINALGNSNSGAIGALNAYNTGINSANQSAVTANNANEAQHGMDQNTANAAAVLAQKHTAYDDLASTWSTDNARNTILKYNHTSTDTDIATTQSTAHSAAGGLYDFDPNLSVDAYAQIKANVTDTLAKVSLRYHNSITADAMNTALNQSFASSHKLIYGYASGGDHPGGLRLVGENGPELEVTGPSRIFSNPQTKSMLDNSELIAEVKALREEVKLLRQDQRAQSSAVAENTKNTVKQMQRWDIDGIPVKTNDPIDVRVIA